MTAPTGETRHANLEIAPAHRAAALWVPATASAAFEHVVAPGESLSAVASVDGLSVEQLAAANGICADSQLAAGSTLAVPPQSGGVVATRRAPRQRRPVGAWSAGAAVAPSSERRYVGAGRRHPPAIAARYGVSVDALAAANGLDPRRGVCSSGSSLSVSGASERVSRHRRRRRRRASSVQSGLARSRPRRP